MDSILKSDIFFFITGAVVIAIGIGAVIAFFYVINILRDVKEVSKTVKNETREIAQDISTMRTSVKNGKAVSGIFGFIKRLFKRKGRKS